MLDQNTLTEILREVAEIIRATAEPMSRDVILGFFEHQDLDDHQKILILDYLLKIQDEAIKEVKEETEAEKEESIDSKEEIAEAVREVLDENGSDLFEEEEPELNFGDTEPAADESVAQFISDMSRYARTSDQKVTTADEEALEQKETAESGVAAEWKEIEGKSMEAVSGLDEGFGEGADDDTDAEEDIHIVIDEDTENDTDQDTGRKNKYPSSPVFKMYLEEIEGLPEYSQETLERLYKGLLAGDAQSIQRISDGWMRRVLEQTVNLEVSDEDFADVIQEGNMALFITLSELCGSYKKVDVEEELCRATMTAMKSFIQGLDSENDIRNVMIGKATLVNEARKHLMEENQQTPSLNELAAYTNMSKSELADILEWIERAEKNDK